MKNKVVQVLLAAKNIAIYSHINIDCDGMGSALALREALLQKGAETVDVFVNSSLPSSFTFYGDLSFLNKKTISNGYDLVVCLDAPSDARLGKYKFTYRKGVKNTLCIDHHIKNESYCKLNYVKDASSTAEILFDVLMDMGVNLTDTICKYLISGIATDTGKFTHTVTDKTFAVLSKLLKFGKLKIEDISNELFNSMKMEVFDLIKLAYEKLEFYADNKLGIIMFSRSDFEKTGTTLDDVDAIPDMPLQVGTVKFAILASEDDQGYFRVSLRSKGDTISARAVAESFGGGGHFNASGCKIFGEFDEVKQKLLDSVSEILGWKLWWIIFVDLLIL